MLIPLTTPIPVPLESPADSHSWICSCGNTTAGSGFDFCDEAGEPTEPFFDGTWRSLYTCCDCGTVIDSSVTPAVFITEPQV